MPKVKPGQIGMQLRPVLSPEFVEEGWPQLETAGAYERKRK